MFDTATGIAPGDQTNTPCQLSSTPAPSTATRLPRLGFVGWARQIVAGPPSASVDLTPEQIELECSLSLGRYIVGDFHP
jgi:hypothetical protein